MGCGVARRQHAAHGLWRNQRRVAVKDQHVAGKAGERFLGGQGGVAGAQLLCLHGSGVRRHRRGDFSHAGADDDDGAPDAGLGEARHQVGDQGPPGQPMQDLGDRGFHARAEARGEDDGG